MSNRIIAYSILVLAAAIFAPALAASAQDGGALPSSWQGWLVLVGVLLFGVAIPVLQRIAPSTKNTVDDKALSALLLTQEWVETNRAMIDEWADPSSPVIPPSPTPPT